MVFIVWDRLFGTYADEDAREPIRYGIVHNIPKGNFLYILFHEWLAIGKTAWQKGLKLKDRLMYIFGRPGWSHDGSSKTTAELRKEMKKE